MEKEFLAQYFYNEGVRRFKPDDIHIDHEARKCYFRVSYDLCVELSFFPDFFSKLCLELASEKLSGQVFGPELKEAIKILETGKKHCSDLEMEKTIDQKIKECQEWFEELASIEKGISVAARSRFHGIEKLEEFWGEGFNVKEFAFNSERGNDYMWQMNTKITKNNNWLNVEFESAHLDITCENVDVLEIHK